MQGMQRYSSARHPVTPIRGSEVTKFLSPQFTGHSLAASAYWPSPVADRSPKENDDDDISEGFTELMTLPDDDLRELYPEMAAAAATMLSIHGDEMRGLRRLLEKTQTESARTLHGLQEQVSALQKQLAVEKVRQAEPKTNPALSSNGKVVHPKKFLTPESSFSEAASLVRSLERPLRTRILHELLAESTPGDISFLISSLEAMKTSMFDIIGPLPDVLFVKIAHFLDFRDIIKMQSVCKRWNEKLKANETTIWKRYSTGEESTHLPVTTAIGWKKEFHRFHSSRQNLSRGEVQSHSIESQHLAPIIALCFCEVTNFLYAASAESISVWSTSLIHKLISSFGYKNTTCIASDPLSDRFAVGSSDTGKVTIYKSSDCSLLSSFSPLHTRGGIRCLSLSKDTCITAGQDKTILFSSISSGTKIARFSTELVHTMKILKEQLIVLTFDGLVRVYDLNVNSQVASIRLPGKELSNIGIGESSITSFDADLTGVTITTKSGIGRFLWTKPSDNIHTPIKMKPKPRPSAPLMPSSRSPSSFSNLSGFGSLSRSSASSMMGSRSSSLNKIDTISVQSIGLAFLSFEQVPSIMHACSIQASGDVIFCGRSEGSLSERIQAAQAVKRSPLGPHDLSKSSLEFKVISLNERHPIAIVKGIPVLGKITCMTSTGYSGFVLGGFDGRLCFVNFLPRLEEIEQLEQSGSQT